jgi:hypothetical protein
MRIEGPHSGARSSPPRRAARACRRSSRPRTSRACIARKREPRFHAGHANTLVTRQPGFKPRRPGGTATWHLRDCRWTRPDRRVTGDRRRPAGHGHAVIFGTLSAARGARGAATRSRQEMRRPRRALLTASDLE